MNRRVKKLWIKALLSGEYEQGRGELRTLRGAGRVTFCCLGVLCDLYAKETKGGSWMFDRFLDNTYDQESSGVLTDGVKDWAGLGLGNPSVSSKDGEVRAISLSVLNDAGRSFEQIAEYIEYSL